MKNTSNNMNRKSILALAGTISLAVASSANGQAAGNDIGSFIGGYSSAAQKIQTVSGTTQTGKRMNQAGQQAFPEFGKPLGTDSCGNETLTQSTNETFIDSNSVWCGTLDHNAETSLARGFIAPADLTLKCVAFGIRENTGGAANVNVRVLVGSPSSLYADLTLVSETVVSVADNTAFALFTAELGEVQIPAGSQFIIELNTPSRVPGLGGDGGLLSFGTNTLGQSSSTYMRASECAMDDFVDVASLGFGNRHLVMSLGYDNGIVPTIQGGFPMAVIGDAVMSLLGDDLVIAGDPNGGEFGVAIDYGTATSGVGATFSVLKDNQGEGTTVSMSFVSETQVNTLRLTDYQGDTSTAVLELDFDSTGFETFDVWVLNDGVLVGILEDQTSGSVIMNATTEGPVEGECGFWGGIDWLMRAVCGEMTISGGGKSITFPYYMYEPCVPFPGGGGGEVFIGSTNIFDIFVGDQMMIVPPEDDTPDSGRPIAMNILTSGVSVMAFDIAANAPTVAIGGALVNPIYDDTGTVLAAQMGVSFSSSGIDSDTVLVGEDVDSDGLADLVASSASGFVSVDMILGGVESASIAFDVVSSVWPPSPIEFSPFGHSINDGKGGCSGGLGIHHDDGCTNPFGTLGTGPWNPIPAEPILWSLNPDFTGMDHESVAYEFFLDGVSVGSISDAQGMMGVTSEIATRAGTLSGDDYGFATYYAGGTTFTTTAGDVFEVDEIQMIAVGSTPPESLSFIQFSAGIGDEDASDYSIVLDSPRTTLAVFNTCPADLSGDGVLNFFDVSAFLGAFGSQQPEADFTNDGLFNFFDVSAFLSAFADGCP